MAATRPTWWSPSTSRCCSDGCAAASSSPTASFCSKACGGRAPTRRSSASYVETYDQLVAAGYRVYEIPMERECRKHRRRCAPRQEHVRARHAVQHLQPRPADRARPDRAHLRQEGRERDRAEREAARGRLRLGGGQSRFQVPHPGHARPPSRRSSSTAIPRSRSACSPRAWKSAPCIRSRRRPRPRTT